MRGTSCRDHIGWLIGYSKSEIRFVDELSYPASPPRYPLGLKHSQQRLGTYLDGFPTGLYCFYMSRKCLWTQYKDRRIEANERFSVDRVGAGVTQRCWNFPAFFSHDIYKENIAMYFGLGN